MDLESLTDWFRQLEGGTPGEVNIANIPVKSPDNKQGVDKGQEILDHLPALLKSGWSIRHIVNVSSQDTLDMLVSLLIRKVNFHHNYIVYLSGFPSTDILPGFIVVPNVGAIQYFPAVSSSESQNVLCYTDKTQIQTMFAYFKGLRRRATLLMDSKNQAEVDWHGLIADIESMPGERLQARELFTVLTEPLSLVEKHYLKKGVQELQLGRFRSMHIARLDALRDQIKYFRFVNIAERKSVEKYIATGERERDEITASPEEVEKQILTEIEFLQNYHNYYLGLTDEEIPVAIQIKSDKVLIEVIKPLSPSERKEEAACINTTNRVLFEAFRHYYEGMWSNIKPEFRQKESVIAWLKAQLNKRR